jgi:hypothetical protein
MDIKQYIKDNQAVLDIDFITAGHDAKVAWYEFLKKSTMLDLSLGHCLQHNQSARISIQLSDCASARDYLNSQPGHELIGTNSVLKHHDRCKIVNSKIVGEKHYISNLGFCDYHVLWIVNQDHDQEQVIFFRDNAVGVSKDLSFDPLGMEATRTGRVLFDHVADYQVLYPLHSQENTTRSHYHNFSFCTVSLALCQRLLEEIQNIVSVKNIELGLDITSHQQQLDLYNDLWYQMLVLLGTESFDSHKIHRIYSQCKLMIAELLKTLMLVGDSRHSQWGPSSQLFRDALTYVTHRQNFSTSLIKYY